MYIVLFYYVFCQFCTYPSLKFNGYLVQKWVNIQYPPYYSSEYKMLNLLPGMSYSGESDTESTSETNIQTYKCHSCNYRPDFNALISLLEQIVLTGPFLLQLPNGRFYVRCAFEDCARYYHVDCLHPSFPDEELGYPHLQDFAENGIHCHMCEPGREPKNY